MGPNSVDSLLIVNQYGHILDGEKFVLPYTEMLSSLQKGQVLPKFL